jgi:hypothetical protein
MKNFLIRILLAGAVTLVAFGLASSARAQQSDEGSAPAASQQSQAPTVPPSSQPQHDAAVPSSGDPQTQEALAFTGRVVQEKSHFVLKDPITKMSYQLNDQAKAKPYLGRQVKVTGKLEMTSNTIHIERIEPLQ